MDSAVLVLGASAILLVLCAALAGVLLRRPRVARGDGAAVLVLTHSPGAQSPRALAHVRALRAHTTLTPVLLAQPPLPAGVCALPIAASAPAPAKRSAPALLMRLLRAARADWAALESARAALPCVACVVLNVPPALPTLPVVVLWAALRARGAPVVVDWHNTSHSILRSTGASPRVVRVAAAAERACARAAAAHWCVSREFQRFLRAWGAAADVVYDAPPAHFRSLRGAADAPAAHALLARVAAATGGDAARRAGFTESSTALTVAASEAEAARWRADPVRLAVTSTSWTPDEDFSVLFAALRRLDEEMRAGGETRLLVVITGKGPLRAAFERRVEKAAFVAVKVWFAWLEVEDYPKLLGVADVGISMHTSSSELDLPMKAVDMLGCGLPVVAYRYRCIGELVREGENGMLFGDAQELVNVLRGLLFDKGGDRRVRNMRRDVVKEFGSSEHRWEETWKREALPSLQRVLGAGIVKAES